MQTSQSYDDQTARISLQISHARCQKQGKQNNLNRASVAAVSVRRVSRPHNQNPQERKTGSVKKVFKPLILRHIKS